MTKIAFTICSNNYLSQAVVLKESFLAHHRGYEFFIGLVDDIAEIENIFPDLEGIVPVSFLDISEFNKMSNRYNITELNTSVKPFYFEYFFAKLKSEWVIYIDPDIFVYNRFEEVEDFLSKGAEVVLTPHLLSPVGEGDISYIREGVFNLGFVAFSKSQRVFEFIKWWQKKLIDQGFFSYSKNLFYDQLWMNLSISFLRKIKIVYHPGYNIAGWNLFERKVIVKDQQYFVNDEETKLVFFHFSGVSFQNSDKFICIHCPNITIRDRPNLEGLLLEYRKKIVSKNYFELKKVLPKYVSVPRRISLKQKVLFFLIRKITKLISNEV
jgi:hypothetical protein